MAVSSILRPREETGGAFNHAPDSGVLEPNSLALSPSSLHSSTSISKTASTFGPSQTFYLLDVAGTGVWGGVLLLLLYYYL
jgi:hypothetical protein